MVVRVTPNASTLITYQVNKKGRYKMSESVNKKNEIVKSMTNIEIYPVVIKSEIGVSNCTKLPLADLASVGTAFEPLAMALNSVINSNGSGLYKVKVPKGMHLAKLKNGLGNIGSALNSNNQVAGQAILNPIMFEPTMVFMAIALANINKKLDSIMEIQEEMLDFVVQKEKSDLKGDLTVLSDILNNYKYNWNNEKFKNGNHIKVLDIKQASERKIDFYHELIVKKANKKSLIKTDQDIKKHLDKIQDDFGNYQLAMYIYSFSTFLEVMLLENFDTQYLSGLTNKIENYSLKYRDLYTKAYNQIESYSNSSIESYLLKGLSGINKVTGQAISKIPIIKNTQVDETLIDVSNKIRILDRKRSKKVMQTILDKQSSSVRPFIENINTINSLYNKPIELVFDQDNIYLVS